MAATADQEVVSLGEDALAGLARGQIEVAQEVPAYVRPRKVGRPQDVEYQAGNAHPQAEIRANCDHVAHLAMQALLA